MRRLLHMRLYVLGVLVLACPYLGCSGHSRPKTIGVEGHVTLAGKPVTQGTVIFQPTGHTEASATHPASGQIAADGTYRMSTFEKGDGVVPGEYRVAVQSILLLPPQDKPWIPIVWAVPEKYVTSATSGLTASIPADGPRQHEINFELKSR